MSLIESVRDYLLTYPGLADNAPFMIETLGKEPTQYSVVPLPGDPVVETYLDDKTLRQFPFAVQSMESTADDLARIAASGFYETLSEWLEVQNSIGNFPILEPTSQGENRTPESIESLGLPILLEFGESGTGVYQLQCRLTYEQEAVGE